MFPSFLSYSYDKFNIIAEPTPLFVHSNRHYHRFDISYSNSSKFRDQAFTSFGNFGEHEEVIYITKPKYHPFSIVGFENAIILSIFIIGHFALLASFLWSEGLIRNLTKTDNLALLFSIEFIFISSLILFLSTTIYNYLKLEHTEYIITNENVHIIQSWPKWMQIKYPLTDIYNIELKADKFNERYSTKDVWLGVWRERPSTRPTARNASTYVPSWERLYTLPDGFAFKEILEQARIHAFEKLKNTPSVPLGKLDK